MSQRPGKTETSKAPKLKLTAAKPRKIKAALKAWGDASDRVNLDPLELDAAPVWVENALAEVVKVVLPGNRLPANGAWNLELVGELMGRLEAFGRLCAGEIVMGAEVQAEHDRFQKFVDSLPQSPERTARAKMLVRDINARFEAVQEHIPVVMKAALASSHDDSVKFQKGLLRGLNLSPDELISANVFERHTRTFYVLALFWRAWVKCKSLREVYDHLCKAVGERQIGSFKAFEKRVAEKIGFRIRGRGRPPGKK